MFTTTRRRDDVSISMKEVMVLFLFQIRLTAHLVVALLLGALYNGAGDEANRVMTNTSCLFFFLLFLFFSNAMPTIHTCKFYDDLLTDLDLSRPFELIAVPVTWECLMGPLFYN